MNRPTKSPSSPAPAPVSAKRRRSRLLKARLSRRARLPPRGAAAAAGQNDSGRISAPGPKSSWINTVAAAGLLDLPVRLALDAGLEREPAPAAEEETAYKFTPTVYSHHRRAVGL